MIVASATLAVSVLAMAAPVHADVPTDFVALVNQLRSSVSVPALSIDPGLTAVAQTWANQMAATGVLGHNPNLSTQAPGGWTKIGENAGTGFSLAATYSALLASPPHYANMVDRAYNRTGVGVAIDTRGQTWVTQDFGAYPPPVPANLTFPTAGTVIFSSPQSFTWNQAPGALYYGITVGRTLGGTDINSGLLQANQLSYPIPALPHHQTEYARIYTYTQGVWIYRDVTFSVV